MRRLIAVLAITLAATAYAQEPWVGAMREVHKDFKGKPGTFAQFGDSITVSMAYWTPLRYERKNMDEKGRVAYERVKAHMLEDCWAKWKGPRFGSEGRMTIRWAHENIDKWLKEHNPEVALIMFGTNDLGQVKVEEYERKLAEVVDRCLANGTVVILSTIPPRSGRLEQCKQFADAVRRVAAAKKTPLVDYLAECLKRRPDDWDGTLPMFRDVPGDEYQVPTLISRDGVHPSNPKKFAGDYSEEALRSSGFAVRNYLTLLAYGQVIAKAL
jgi:hypothetical protein